MTDKRCKELIDLHGVNRNPISGIPGVFYTVTRSKDLQELCVDILSDRLKDFKTKKISP